MLTIYFFAYANMLADYPRLSFLFLFSIFLPLFLYRCHRRFDYLFLKHIYNMEVDTFKTLVETNLPDNNTRQITPRGVRELFNGSDLNTGLIDTLDKGKADTDGYYTNMSVGLTENLISEDGVTNEQPYIFRTTAGDTSVGSGYGVVEEMRGNSVVWNQLLKNPDYSNGTTDVVVARDGVGVTVDSGIATYTYTSVGYAFGRKLIETPSANHKYYVVSKVKHSDSSNITFRFNTSYVLYSLSVAPNTWTIMKAIVTPTESTYPLGVTAVTTSTFTSYMSDFENIIDLTQMFGSDNEPSTVAEFEALYPQSYYAYTSAPFIVNNTVDTLETVGFNQWNEKWYLVSQRVLSRGLIPILPSTQYYFHNGTTSTAFTLYWWTKNGTKLTDTYIVGNSVFTTPTNAYYMGFALPADYGTTYNNDVCINISHSGLRDGEYEAYWKNTLDLSAIKSIKDADNNILFPDGLRSAGSVYDEITSTKAIKRVGSVDLGSLTWTVGSNGRKVSAVIDDCKSYADTEKAKLLVTANYTVATVSGAVESNNLRIASYAKKIYIIDNSYEQTTDGIAQFKTAMSGVMLNYELETPVEVDFETVPQTFGTALDLTYREDDWGTEWAYSTEDQDNTVPTTAPFAHKTFYMDNLVDKIRNIDGNTDAGACMNPSFTNLLTTLSTGIGRTITKTWDSTNYCWTFSMA